MEQKQVNRRDFLQTAAAVGAVALTIGNTFNVFGSDSPILSVYVCSICGHLEFNTVPGVCPVCHAAKEAFQRNDTVFTDAESKFKEKTLTHAPTVTAYSKSTLVTEEPAIAVETKIGKTLHPMEQSHYIRFIDCYIDDKYVTRLLLTLATHPTVSINIKQPGKKIRIVALCNLHGYWQSETTVM